VRDREKIVASSPPSVYVRKSMRVCTCMHPRPHAVSYPSPFTLSFFLQEEKKMQRHQQTNEKREKQNPCDNAARELTDTSAAKVVAIRTVSSERDTTKTKKN